MKNLQHSCPKYGHLSRRTRPPSALRRARVDPRARHGAWSEGGPRVRGPGRRPPLDSGQVGRPRAANVMSAIERKTHLSRISIITRRRRRDRRLHSCSMYNGLQARTPHTHNARLLQKGAYTSGTEKSAGATGPPPPQPSSTFEGLVLALAGGHAACAADRTARAAPLPPLARCLCPLLQLAANHHQRSTFLVRACINQICSVATRCIDG